MAIEKEKRPRNDDLTTDQSEEYKRFESLLRRLIKVPKKELNARREAEHKRA